LYLFSYRGEEMDELLSVDEAARMRQIFGSIAQYDRAMTVAKLRGAREGHQGPMRRRKAYGARPGESEIIDRMKTLGEGGMAVDKIAAALNTEDAKPRAGEQWYSTSVYRILKAANAL
jgi:hypothetical protein